MSRYGEVARYFLWLGTVGFGGPNAHIAAMHDELVRRRGWVDERHFLDIVGVTNLIPGPNSSEIAIHLGYLRAGRLGGLLAGVAFAAPAFAIVTALAWAYFEVGAFTLRGEMLAGVQAVALAAIVATLWRLRAGATGSWRKTVLAVAALGTTLVFPAATPVVVLAGGFANVLAAGAWRGLHSLLPLSVLGTLPALATTGTLAWVFFRTGLLLFGGGLVLVPLLAPEVVGRGWLTEREFLDGIALGQATAGPIVIAAAFVGYGVAGFVGAGVATIAIYVPAFLAVLAGTGPFLARFRERPLVSEFVEGVTAAALGTVVAAAALLSRAGLASWFRVGVFAIAVAAIALRVPIVVVVVVGAIAGAAAGALGVI